MRRGVRAVGVGVLAACALIGFASAFAVAATAGADPGSAAQTTDPPPTDPPPPTEPPIEPPSPPTPAPISFGVTVGNVAVGGLLPYEAAVAVKTVFGRPLVLVVAPTRKIRIEASALGARPNVPKAIRRARLARPGAVVPLDVDVSRIRVRNYLERLGRELDQKPLDAKIVLRGVKPRAVPAQDGRHLRRLGNARAVRLALKTNIREPIQLAFDVFKPKVRAVKLGPAVVILRETKTLLFFAKEKLVRRFGIATGQSSYPTPLGSYEIVRMERNPWWYPPPSGWAAESSPVPPGPGNPLGTRWMGISAPYVGIHGTPDSASIGYSASHGCIRMRIPEAEWLFRRVEIGTPVFIISR